MVFFEDDDSAKELNPVPPEMRACHITVLGDYTAEGHIPIETLESLLAERPDIDGLVLPGMPSGSPGMPGMQTEDFIIHSITDGIVSKYLTLGK